MVARLTPDQKVACSNHVVVTFFSTALSSIKVWMGLGICPFFTFDNFYATINCQTRV